MKRFLCVFLCVASITVPVFAQNAGLKTLMDQQAAVAQMNGAAGAMASAGQTSGLSVDGNLTYTPQLALSAGFYPVTAGDVYELAYAAGTTPVVYKILVDSSYKVRVANLAVIDASGKSFAELKAQVETIVSKNYPLSGVQFGLEAPSIFRITVKGEVSSTSEQQAWPLTRLSAAISSCLTNYSSIRDVKVQSANGKAATYDLFRALRLGDLSQDPLLRPDDVITVSRYSRSVNLSGAVARPGSYQLLPGENLKELIAFYGNGYTQVSDPSRIEIVRYVGSSEASGNKLFLNDADVDGNFALSDYDTVYVSSITDLIPVMFMEGALSRNGQADSMGEMDTAQGVSPEASDRFIVRFNRGENYASLARRYRNSFSAVSDTANAYIVRAGERIPLNLNPMLYDAAYRSEYQVEPNDVLVIPFRQYFVTVSGSVKTPGRYPYIPDRDWAYYIALAGGFDTLKNARQTVRISNVTGKKMAKEDPITPETVIEASTNSFLFYFNQYAPVVTTTLTAISTSLTVYLLLRN